MVDVFEQLKFLRLTQNGKDILSTIPRSILFKAKQDYERIERYILRHHVNTYYAICLRFCDAQKTYPDWNLAGNFDINQPISKTQELFSMRLALKIEEHLENDTKDFTNLRDKLLHLNPDGTEPDPMEPLRDAIKSGQVDLKGLKFLQSCYSPTKPDLIHEINKFIAIEEEKIISAIKEEALTGDIKDQQNICISVETVL